jgi:hypothetical protein
MHLELAQMEPPLPAPSTCRPRGLDPLSTSHLLSHISCKRTHRYTTNQRPKTAAVSMIAFSRQERTAVPQRGSQPWKCKPCFCAILATRPVMQSGCSFVARQVTADVAASELTGPIYSPGMIVAEDSLALLCGVLSCPCTSSPDSAHARPTPCSLPQR